jgi:hypothetical protein|tara:strand:+ start:1003 stop:1239 length:237 start_codon:yes stop_codon:yes gene_type:complete
MKRLQRILALDAAIFSAEELGESCELSDAVSQVKKALEPIIDEMDSEYPKFSQFLKAQREAIEALSKDPDIFGVNNTD